MHYVNRGDSTSKHYLALTELAMESLLQGHEGLGLDRVGAGTYVALVWGEQWMEEIRYKEGVLLQKNV